MRACLLSSSNKKACFFFIEAGFFEFEMLIYLLSHNRYFMGLDCFIHLYNQ